MRLGKDRKSCGFMMESLEVRQMLTGATDGVIVDADPQAPSDIVIEADAPTEPVAAPTGVNVSKIFSTSLIVAWTDQSTSESGHRIERSADNAVWTTVGTVGPNVVSFQDTGLTPDTSYYYRVVAFDFVSEFASDAISAATSSQLLQVTYDNNGPSTINYNGTTLLNTTISPYDGFSIYDYKIIKWNGDIVIGDGHLGLTTSWNPDTHTLTYDYPWGRVATQYVQDVDRLNLIITVTNKSTKNTLAGVTILPMAIQFPDFPIGYTATEPKYGYNGDGPTAIPADWQSGMLAAVNDDVAKPLYLGLMTSPQTLNNHKYFYWVGSMPFWSQPSSWTRFDRPIAPGGSDQYTVSLRFAPSGATAHEIAPDTFASAAAQFPFENNWSDRRSIGYIHIANYAIAGTSIKNPRGYFGGSFDVRTKTGQANFRKRLLNSANSSITILKNMNAQGMIVWDLEGEQYSKINYVGDPRMLSTLAPEMEYQGAVDAYFKKFTDAGLKVGVAIRGQRLKMTKLGWRQVPVANPYSMLAAKIAYAHTHWGATLFYVDSNTWKAVYDASIFKQLHDMFPDALIIPEWETTRYYAYTTPYKELRYGETSTPDSALQAYPTSFSAINVTAGDIDGHHAQLVSAVRHGDILLFRGWFDAEENQKVKAIYDEALGTPAV